MSELRLTHKENGVERVFDAWRSSGEVKLRLRELSFNYSTEKQEVVIDNTVGYELADDDETVAHDGDGWRQYVKKRFETLNNKRF